MKNRGLIALIMALTLCLGLYQPVCAAGSEYEDVPDGHWASGSVARATELGLFYGEGADTFGVGQPINRAAFTTALVRLFRWEEMSSPKSVFTDVAPNAWYFAAVETAAANGALAAADRNFRPTDPITREEMAAMLVRGLGYTSLAGTASGHVSPFTDVTTNKGFITLAYDMGILGGVGDGRFDPTGTATREQAAAMLVRVYDRLYTRSVRMAAAGGYTKLEVPVPKPDPGDEMPTTPLEPLTDLYNLLREMKDRGTDMGRVVLRLTGGGMRTMASSSGELTSEALTAREIEELLTMDNINTYYSDRYQSAYCIYQTDKGQEATVWYQSEESLAAKLQLARLFGVTRYMLV